MEIWHALGQQLRHPHGLGGRLVGRLMRRANDLPTRAAVSVLGAGPGDIVLDAGCGPGHAVALLTERVGPHGRVVGFDQSVTMIAQALAANAKAAKEGRVALAIGDFAALPYAPESFDRILASNVIYFWEDPAAIVAGLRRLLRPGGRLVIYATEASSMARWKFAGTDTHRHYDRRRLAAAIEAGGFAPGEIAINSLTFPWEIQGLLATADRN